MGLRILDPKGATDAARRGRCALTIMAKAPRAGRVKTRLSPPLSLDDASALGVCFLRDTAENLCGVARGNGADVVVSYTPIGDESLFDDVVSDEFALIAQRGGGFGERLLHTAEDLFACGYASVCLIDSDSPTVPAAAYAQAVEELRREGERIVLGPAADGGYYLIGMKTPRAELFEGVRWSTDAVLEDTRDRAERLRLEVVELPLWYDVDDAPALDILWAELLAGIAPGFAVIPGYGAPQTRKLLSRFDPAVNAGKGLALDAGGAAAAAVDHRERPPAFASARTRSGE